MTYKSPAALEMAVKEAAKASPRDTGRAISGFYFHRLLCRVFAGGNSSFVLKGGPKRSGAHAGCEDNTGHRPSVHANELG